MVDLTWREMAWRGLKFGFNRALKIIFILASDDQNLNQKPWRVDIRGCILSEKREANFKAAFKSHLVAATVWLKPIKSTSTAEIL
jgi:hypothetical protein